MMSRTFLVAVSIATWLLSVPGMASCEPGPEMEHISEEDGGAPGAVDIPKLKIRGFSDLLFKLKITKGEDTSTFALGEVDLFITSEISDRVNFLTEAVFYPEIETDEPGYELENHPDFELQRVTLKYSLSDLFNIAIGRMHTPLGYWNHAYHHGTWLQMTIFRPEIYRFEYVGGVLPVHSVGIQFYGTEEFGAFDLEYHLGVLNGRGKTIDEVQNFKDENASKAVSALLSLKPHFPEGLQLGTAIYFDRIPPDPPNLARTASIAERMVGGHLVYLSHQWVLLGELFKIDHSDRTSGNDFDTLGYYLQVGYRIDKVTPYYRYDFINFGDGDPYFIPSQTDISKHTLGLRWDILTWNALKFEYSFTDQKDRDQEHSVTANTSFTF